MKGSRVRVLRKGRKLSISYTKDVPEDKKMGERQLMRISLTALARKKKKGDPRRLRSPRTRGKSIKETV